MTSTHFHDVEKVIGLDFSGAETAGKSIWLAEIDATSGAVSVLLPAADLPAGGTKRKDALNAIVGHLLSKTNRLIGADFPFTLPVDLMPDGGLSSLVDRFDGFETAEAFRDACRRISKGKEWRRACDLEAKTPFSPYNLRLYRQTYWGIRGLVAPLLREGTTCFPPLHVPRSAVRSFTEICPASTLKAGGLYRPYKGKGSAETENRAVIIDWLTDVRGVTIPNGLREIALNNAGGDALDALIAGSTALELSHCPEELSPRPGTSDAREGRVYF